MHHRVCTRMYIHWPLLFLFTESLATGYFTSFAWWSTLHVAPPQLHLLPFFCLLADLSTGLLASSAVSLASLHESLALRSWQSSSPATVPHGMVVVGGTRAGVMNVTCHRVTCKTWCVTGETSTSVTLMLRSSVSMRVDLPVIRFSPIINWACWLEMLGCQRSGSGPI